MIRQLVVELQRIKNDVNSSVNDLSKKKLAIQRELAEIEEKEANTKPQLDRANLFSQSHGNSAPPVCPRCFIYDDRSSNMLATDSPSPQIDVFRCKFCDWELRVDA